MNMNRTKSNIGCSAVARLFFLVLVMIAIGCEKSDLPPEQVAVDVMMRCVRGTYDGLDVRVAGDVANFVARDREMRKNGHGWFASVKEASFEVVDVKIKGDSAFVCLKAVLDGRQEKFPLRLEKSKDRKWQVVSFHEDKQEMTK